MRFAWIQPPAQVFGLEGVNWTLTRRLDSDNIYCNKVSAFTHSGVCCHMSEKIPDPPKKNYGSLPSMGVPVQVQCDGFKCMAFLDREGRWVDLFSREFVSRVLGVVPA
jgi:hypothetical protein